MPAGGAPPSVYFPERKATAVDYGQARAICAGCPVVEPCLRAGMGEAFGMWGGLSPRERQQLRRRHER
ncbi:MAG: WhiB family transcriptional regulator, partial [Acidimicrobiales bacterium]